MVVVRWSLFVVRCVLCVVCCVVIVARWLYPVDVCCALSDVVVRCMLFVVW